MSRVLKSSSWGHVRCELSFVDGSLYGGGQFAGVKLGAESHVEML